MSKYETGKPIHKIVSVFHYRWFPCSLFFGIALPVLGHKKTAGGFVRRVTDRCISGMGWNFPALLSKEVDAVHRQLVPNVG